MSTYPKRPILNNVFKSLPSVSQAKQFSSQKKSIAKSGWEFERKRMEILGDSYINYKAQQLVTVAQWNYYWRQTDEDPPNVQSLICNESIAQTAASNGLSGLVAEMMQDSSLFTQTLRLLLDLSLLEFSKCRCTHKTFNSWRSTKQFADRIESLVGLLLLGEIGREKKCNQFLDTYLNFGWRLEVKLNKYDRGKKEVLKSGYSILSDRSAVTNKKSRTSLLDANRTLNESRLRRILGYKFQNEEFHKLALDAISNSNSSSDLAKVTMEMKQLGIDALRYVFTHHLVTNFDWMTSHEVASIRTQLLSTDMMKKLIMGREERKDDNQMSATRFCSSTIGVQLTYRQFEQLAGLVCMDCNFNTRHFWHVFRPMYSKENKKRVNVLNADRLKD